MNMRPYTFRVLIKSLSDRMLPEVLAFSDLVYESLSHMTAHRPVIGVHRCLCILVFMCSRTIALPLYADASHKSLSLVLCTGLDRAVSNLRHQLLSAHAVGAEWLEEDCVAIDPCQELFRIQFANCRTGRAS
jgi:hypothetical protein